IRRRCTTPFPTTAVARFHEGHPVGSAARSFDLERVLSRTLEAVRVAGLLPGCFGKEGQRGAFPLPPRWLGRSAHRVEPVPEIALLVRVVSHHAVPAEHDLAVLLFFVVLHEEEAVDAQSRLRPTSGGTARTPRRRVELLDAGPGAFQSGELAVVLRRLRHSERHVVPPV